MAKRFRKKKAFDNTSPSSHDSKVPFSGVWIALLLAVVAFLAYWPSLKSGFVYDARVEIIQEGFITSISNLPAVLSLKVLSMNLMLGPRPGQLLYLMLNAAIWGKEPFGYHLSSNLLHAANVALLFVLLQRLIATEIAGLTRSTFLKVQLAIAAATLIFALHPISVESVAEVSYSSSLLVVFFTLLALLAATFFRPEKFRAAMLIGSVGAFCAFASVMCKESGIATPLLLIVYWFLFRRREAKLTWLLFLGAATVMSAIFLAARFLLAPSAPPDQASMGYLGGSISFSQVFSIQPRLWVFMMGKLMWPAQLSADYVPVDMIGPPTTFALAILVVVILMQAWLAYRSRLGALGIAVYWLGLAPVSNFIPLYHALADRFYYLPLAGLAMQLLALLLMTLKWNRIFWVVIALFLGALLPLSLLTLTREDVFANDISLWTDTLQVSPRSSLAHYNLGIFFDQKERVDDAMDQFQKALEINPNIAEAHSNLGLDLLKKGQLDEAIIQFQKALEIRPNYAEAHNNLGNGFSQKGQMEEAMIEFQKALEINPNNAEVRNNLGIALFQKKQVDEAIIQYQKALEIDPRNIEAHNNLGVALIQKGQWDGAVYQFQEVVRLKPDYEGAQNNLLKAKAMARQREN